MLKIGLDTGCINAKGKVDVLNFIDKMEQQGLLEKVMINVSGDELKRYRAGYQKYMATNIELQYGRFDIGIFGQCVYGNSKTATRADKIAKKLFDQTTKELFDLSRENDFRDIMIINRAIGLGVDIFLTIDKVFTKNSRDEWFENEFCVKVRYVEREGTNNPLIEEISKLI